MKRADYALIGITIIASLLITVPLLIGLNDEGYLPIAFAQSFNATTNITFTNGTTVNVPAFIDEDGTLRPYWEYIYPYVEPTPVQPTPVEPTPVEPTPVQSNILNNDNVVITEGKNFKLIKNYNTGIATWSPHPEGIVINGESQPYELKTTNQKIIFNSNTIGGLTYDIPTCSYSLKENGFNGNQIIPSVSIVGTAKINDIWQNLPVNNEICNVSVIQNENIIQITSTKTMFDDITTDEFIPYNGTESIININDISYNIINQSTNGTSFTGYIFPVTSNQETQKLTHIIELDITKGIKETFKLYDINDYPLGISQTIHTGETITINNETIDIVQYNGQTFDREFIVANQAEILEIADGLNYDFDVGIDSLDKVNILFEDNKYKVNMDYANGSFIHNLYIDPTTSYSNAGQYTFTVPDGITQVTIKTWGAGGTGTGNAAGGVGGYAQGTVTVTPNQNLIVKVGSPTGGGAGGTATGGAYGAGGSGKAGGGYSGVFASSLSHANTLVLAGAGGGGGGVYQTTGGYGGAGGGSSGRDGQNGYSGTTGSVFGGTQTAGGEGYAAGSALTGNGGQSICCSTYVQGGGGGGSGYYGGAGGWGSTIGTGAYNSIYGGAGGSGYVISSATNTQNLQGGIGSYPSGPGTPPNTSDLDYIAGVGTANNAGRVVISYTLPLLAPTSLTVEQTSTSSVYLSWTAPINSATPTGYKIDLSVNGAAYTTLVANNPTTTFAYGGLTLGSEYSYRVYTLSGASVSSTYASALITIMNPPPNPSNFIAINGIPINLDWDVPMVPQYTAQPTGYKVFRIGENYGIDLPNLSGTTNGLNFVNNELLLHGSTPMKIHTFTSGTNTFTLTGSGNIQYLVVGGGGSGGGSSSTNGGGGGAGAFRTGFNFPITTGTYTAIVGGGGSGGGNGGLSSFSTITSDGGAGGANYNNNGVGNGGGSGGGAGGSTTVVKTGGVAGTYGFAGGNTIVPNTNAALSFIGGGGGGGSSTNGVENGVAGGYGGGGGGKGGAGGFGTVNPIVGSTSGYLLDGVYCFAGGGGGGHNNNGEGGQGFCGGGRGGGLNTYGWTGAYTVPFTSAGYSATTNTGSGGGGSGGSGGVGSGGSGIVILKYLNDGSITCTGSCGNEQVVLDITKDLSINNISVTSTSGSSVSGTINTATQDPNISFTNTNLPDNTDNFSIGGWVKLDLTLLPTKLFGLNNVNFNVGATSFTIEKPSTTYTTISLPELQAQEGIGRTYQSFMQTNNYSPSVGIFSEAETNAIIGYDTTSIPDNAIISSITYTTGGGGGAGGLSSQQCAMFDLTQKPTLYYQGSNQVYTIGSRSLFDDSTSGNKYRADDTCATLVYGGTYSLNNFAVENLQNNLVNNWFGFGIDYLGRNDQPPKDNGGYTYVSGSDATARDLSVTYSLPTPIITVTGLSVNTVSPQHYVVNRDGSTWTVYQNGVLKSTTTSSESLGTNVGKQYSTNIDGNLDELFINSQPLTQTEITNIYERGQPTQIGTTNDATTNFSDTNVVFGNSFYYTAKTTSSTKGDSSFVTPFVLGNTIPLSDPPTNVIATNGITQANLSWTAPVQPAGGVLQAYKIYKNDNGGLPDPPTDQYKIHTFLNTGTTNFNISGSGTVEYLVIGGGGGGGGNAGGGGGAGGYRTATGFPVTTQTYPIMVGAGGAGGTQFGNGVVGANSVFSTIISNGGGYGSTDQGGVGGNGGSGGGAGADQTSAGGTATSGQGNNGAAGLIVTRGGTGGGGGSGAVGNQGASGNGGNGGSGTASSITGTSITRAGGGGGGELGNHQGAANAGAGGSGGGGNGGDAVAGVAGTANTGGGGGGGGNNGVGYVGGAGGPGIVIIKYLNDGSITCNSGCGNISYFGSVAGDDGYDLLAQPAGTGTSYTDLVVVGGTTYAYKIVAVNQAGDSAMSSPATVMIGSPSSAPLSLTSGQTIANQINLNWLVPSNSGSTAITGYNIYLGGVLIDTVGNVLTYTDSITGAEIGALLSYTVKAINGNGESVASNTSTITSWNVPGQVVGTGTAAVQPILNWVAPASDDIITNYKIFRDGSLIATLGNVLTYTDITGTTPGQSYEYNISAVSAVGEGAQSADIIVSAGTNPNAPTNLTVTPLAGADHRLDWTAPSYNGGIAISNYIIQRSESSNTGFTTIATVGNVLTYTDQDPNLVLNNTYYYKVLAVNSIGNSPTSNVANGLTGDKPNAITDVTVTAVANKQINVNWSAPNANYYPITSYQVFASENGGVAVSVGTPTITLFQHTNLNIGSTYTYSVYAINNLGTSNISNTPNALAGDIPGVPTNLTVTPIVPSRLDVSWGASTPNAYTPTYTLAFSTNSGSTWNETTYTNLSALIQSHTNLVNGQTYQYKVSATNTLGTSAYTAVVSGKAGDVPSTPTNIQITTVSTTQLTFAWGVPNDNGYTLTGYLVEQSTDNQQWTILNSNYQSNVYYDSGLTQNTQYYYRVSAINALGTSAPSTPASGQTFGIPNVINNLTTTTISTSQIDLAWSHPALNGYALVGYTVQRSLDTTTWVTQTVTSNNSYQDSQNTSVNTKYYYRVITANTFGSSAPSNVAIGYTLPTATAAVTTTVQSDTQIDLVWNNPSGTAHTGFFIEQSVNAGNTWTTLTTTTNQNLSYNVVGLTPLTDYQFRVSTVNPAGTSGPSPVATAKTFGSPEVPTGTTATPLIGSQIRLDWVGPSNTNGSPVTGYKIERSTNNGLTWGTLVANTNSVAVTYTDTGLTTTQQYNYRISAINIYGTGQPGAQAFATASDVPSQVTGLTATPSINYTIDLSWTTPNGNGYPVNGYKIERNIANAGWVILVANTASTITNYDDINLTENISYQYRVSAINFVGTGIPSAIATSNAGDVPNAPVLTLTALPNSIIKLDWTIPSSNGFAITTYQVEKSINGGSSWTSLTSVNANTFQDNNLINGNTYQYRISATNQIGSSVFSSGVSIIAGDTPGSVNPLTTTTLSNTSIQLNWVSPNANGYTVTGYKIERSTDTGLTWYTVTANTQSVATVFTDTGLTTGTYYTYKVSGINALGIGVASSISTTHAGGVPNIPVLTLTALPNSIIQLDWTTPATNGFTITSYQIEKSINGGTSWTPLTSVNANTFQDPGLINGNTYQYRISATNIIGESAFSVGSSMKAGDVPSAVGSFTATTLSNTSVRLDWTAPNANGYAVTGYKVEQSIDGVTFTTTSLNTQSTALTYTVTGLNAKTDYYFKVVGINALGNGVSSAIPSAHTFGSPDAFTPMTSSSTTTSATLNWVSPYNHGSPVTSYRVEILNFVNGIGNSQWLTLTTTTGLTNTHNNLQSNTQYQYRVVAINPYGTSTSNAQPITTLAVPPTLTATSTSGTTINLSWTTVANSPTYNLYSSDNNITFVTEQLGLTGTTYQDTGLTLGQTIYYKVSVVNAGGESAQSTSAQATTWTLPGVPTSLSLTNPTPITARLTWIAPTNYGGAPSVTYNVQRSTDNANWSLYQNTSTSPFIDSVLTAGQVYYWRVNTVTAAGNSVNSNVVQYTTPSLPTAPGSLTVALTGSTNSASVLNWVAPSDTSGYNVIGYQIERNVNSAGFSVLVADTGTSGTVYTNTGLSAGVEYVYRVSAITGVGLGSPSNTASIQPVLAVLTITGSPTGGNSVLISSSISVTGGSPSTIIQQSLYKNNARVEIQALNVNLVSGAILPTMTSYPTQTSTFFITVTLNTGFVIQSNSISLTPDAPFTSGDISLSEDRIIYTSPASCLAVGGIWGPPSNPLSDTVAVCDKSYTESNLQFTVQPTGARVIVSYQPQDINQPAIVKAVTSTSSSITIETPVNSETDYYGSIIVNPNFDYTVNSDGSIVVICEPNDIMCDNSDNNPLVPGVQNSVPNGVPSERTFKSFKSPDSKRQLGLEPMGDLFGVNMIFIFIIAMAAIFTGKSAPMGVIFIAVTLGVMAYLGYLDFGNDALNSATWALIIITAILGVFLGKRWS